MSGPMDLDQLLIEYEPEVGLKKPLGRSLTIPELKKFVAGKPFLDLGGKITSETTLRQADKLIKERVRRHMLQTYRATDPKGHDSQTHHAGKLGGHA